MHLYFSFTINKILQNKLNDNQNHKHCEKKSIENHKKTQKTQSKHCQQAIYKSTTASNVKYFYNSVFPANESLVL